MTRRLTLQEFVERSNVVHQGKYSYALISERNYTTLLSVVPIICPIHGCFEQLAENHVRGHGCERCAKEKPKYNKRKKVCGAGVLDIDFSSSADADTQLAYVMWDGMLRRCYGTRKLQSYIGCSVCEEWHYFSNFKKWFNEHKDEYHKGYHLDKDILSKGNKVYSPDTCCLVPQEINKLITKEKRDKKKKNTPIGVSLSVRGRCVRYHAYVSIMGKRLNLGYFTDEKEAFHAYKEAKEKHIQEMATKYFNEGKITDKVYNALMNYKVEITD